MAYFLSSSTKFSSPLLATFCSLTKYPSHGFIASIDNPDNILLVLLKGTLTIFTKLKDKVFTLGPY